MDELEHMVQSLGFASKQEFDELVAGVNLSTNARKKAFKNWQHYDCSKEGLLKLDTAEYPEPIMQYRFKRTHKHLLWTHACTLYNHRNGTDYEFETFIDKIIDDNFCLEFDDLCQEIRDYEILLRNDYDKALELKESKYKCLDFYLELVEVSDNPFV